MLKTIELNQAPPSRTYGAARSLQEFDDALKASRALPAGKVVVIQFTKEQLVALGGKNPLNTFAQAIRNEWRISEDQRDKTRICYTAKPDRVCIKHGTPRKNIGRKKPEAKK